jgi:hypothetical protein
MTEGLLIIPPGSVCVGAHAVDVGLSHGVVPPIIESMHESIRRWKGVSFHVFGPLQG